MNFFVMQSARSFRAAIGLLAALLFAAVDNVYSDTLVVPVALENTDANSESVFPASLNALGGFRIMQVYDAAPFLAASAGRPIAITQFALRPDAVAQTTAGTMEITLDVYLSTTSRSPDASSPNFLSDVFAENVESTEMLVLEGTLPLTSAGAPGGGAAGPFDVLKPFHEPFVYDPTAGNLLLDLRIENVGSSIIVTDFVRADAAGVGVARILGISANATAATDVAPFGPPYDRTGLVTEFTWTIVPEPTSIWLAGIGILGLLAASRDKRLGTRPN